MQLWALTDLYEAIAGAAGNSLRVLLWYFATCIINTGLYVIREGISILIELHFRRKLTVATLQSYLSQHAYLSLKHFPEIDNPDQRVAEDAAGVANRAVTLSVSFCSEVVALVSFLIVLRECGHGLGLHSAWALPGLALLVSGIGTAVGLYLGRRLAPLENSRELAEATFRKELMLIREQAHQIAGMQEEGQRAKLLQAYFAQILQKQRSWLFSRMRLESFRISERDLNKVTPLAVIGWCALPAVSISVLIKTAGAFVAVVDSGQWLVKHLATIRTLKATSWRLGKFLEYLNLHTPKPPELQHHPLGHMLPQWCQQLEALELHPQQWVLIQGGSGSGKSSLLTVLHNRLSGVILVPHSFKLHVGSIRDLCDPHGNYQLSELAYHLSQLGLAHLCDALQVVRNWGDILSNGEQRRLAVLNAALQQPAWILMDEPLAILDQHAAERVLTWLKRHSTARILVTAHATPALVHFDYHMHLDGERNPIIGHTLPQPVLFK